MQEDARQAAVKSRLRDHVARDQRVAAGPALDRDEAHHSITATASMAIDPRIAPAPVVDLVEGDQQRDEPERDRRDPRVVDPLIRRPPAPCWWIASDRPRATAKPRSAR